MPNSDKDNSSHSYEENDKEEMKPYETEDDVCMDHEVYGNVCPVEGLMSAKCPRKECPYITKTATIAAYGGTRITVELTEPYERTAWQCKGIKKCGDMCKCSNIWCKVKETRDITVYMKKYKDVRVYIPYPCGCQCRETSNW